MSARSLAQGVLVGALCVALVLVVRPVCPIYATFHVLCPGCGGTRALQALLQGDVRTAWRMNALLVGAIPVGIGYLGMAYWSAVRRGSFAWPPISGVALSFCVAVTLLFSIRRNL